MNFKTYKHVDITEVRSDELSNLLSVLEREGFVVGTIEPCDKRFNVVADKRQFPTTLQDFMEAL